MAVVPVGTAQMALLSFTAARVKDSELSDKAEAGAGMLTGANLAGVSERLFPVQEDLHCISRQTEQTAPMCEVDDLSHSQEAQWKDRHTRLV